RGVDMGGAGDGDLPIDRHGEAAIRGIAAGIASRGHSRGRADREGAAARRIGGDKWWRTATATGVDVVEHGGFTWSGRDSGDVGRTRNGDLLVYRDREAARGAIATGIAGRNHHHRGPNREGAAAGRIGDGAWRRATAAGSDGVEDRHSARPGSRDVDIRRAGDRDLRVHRDREAARGAVATGVTGSGCDRGGAYREGAAAGWVGRHKRRRTAATAGVDGIEYRCPT